MRPHALLVTGFGPFPGVSENSSAWLVETLAWRGLASRLGCELHAEVLPTEWAEVAARAVSLLDRHRPRLVLHLGLSRRARSFRIERCAHNRIEPRLDARGTLPEAAAVVARGCARLDSRIPAAQLTKHLKQLGLPATASRSAGTYLCNFLYYRSLDWACRQESPCHVGFVHVPPGPRQGGPLSETDLVRGAEAILRYLLAYAAKRDGMSGSSRFRSVSPAERRTSAGRT